MNEPDFAALRKKAQEKWGVSLTNAEVALFWRDFEKTFDYLGQLTEEQFFEEYKNFAKLHDELRQVRHGAASSGRKRGRYRKPLRNRIALVRFVLENWHDCAINSFGELEFRKKQPRLPWREIADQWNAKHPESQKKPDTLRREFYRSLDECTEFFRMVWYYNMPLDLLRAHVAFWQQVADTSELDLSKAEDKAFYEHMRPLIEKAKVTAEKLERVLRGRTSGKTSHNARKRA
jgi:hypothetical protein